MISNLNGDRMSPAEAAKRLGVHTATVWRWIHRGVRGGQQLATIWIGGRQYITAVDLDGFLRRIQQVDNVLPPRIQTTAAERAERELRRLLGSTDGTKA